MTTLLPPPQSKTGRSSEQVRQDLTTRRPLVLLATGGGVAAAAATLLVCLATGLAGWYLTDGGSHGAPRYGLRVGALSWLMGHGSGVSIDGVAVTAMPLGITLLSAWAIWRTGHRLGASVAGHGPDAGGIADGQRDVVVPLAASLFAAGYAVTAVATATVAASASTSPSVPRVVLWSLLLCLVVGVPAIAAGSGRAAIWTAALPVSARATAHVARRVVLLWLLVSLVGFLVALVVDFSTAANVMGQLGGGGGAVVLVVVLGLVLLPNAVLFSGSYLLGPGFTVGTGTLVSPGGVVLGALPAFPMLAALPDDGPVPAWTGWLVLLPPLVAFVAAAWSQWVWPTAYYVEGAVRGAAGGIMAGVLFSVAASLSGGAVGPGRMRDVAPYAFDVLLHAVTAFGIGGLVGGLVVTWWQRRTMPVEIELDQ
ncbi:DUF6350 family protein [Nocardioides sp.]|uniref:cell division protein PerM n=1 Tax=Nocardioides sp. TaxID=35761 RepID=UPI00271BA495|nr:DUF6350 family protein [Nocardioides sp.]MDO9455112.1 DUF6350 family protein [Nocardioides sp.]